MYALINKSVYKKVVYQNDDSLATLGSSNKNLWGIRLEHG